MKTKRLLATLLVLMMTLTLSASAVVTDFTDVPATHPYKTAIDFCRENGIVQGITDTLFAPDASVTRGQFAVIWCRSLLINSNNPVYTDITKLNSYYDSSIIVLTNLGVMNGVAVSRFAPNGILTREQLAVLTKRTYKIDAEDAEAYKAYTDNESISSWARESISACMNAEVFDGLYDDAQFKPQQPVTRAELCKLIYNINVPYFDITIGAMTGGTVTADVARARPGTLVTLTVTPEEGKQPVEGSLKFNDEAITENSFFMPGEDVTITAEFEDKAAVTLSSIDVTTPPTKVAYTVGDTLDLTGIVVTAQYSDDTTAAVTGFTTDPAAGSTLDTVGTITITVSYTAEGVTKTDTFDVEVTAAVS